MDTIIGNKIIATYEGGYFVPAQKNDVEHFEFDKVEYLAGIMPYRFGRAVNPAWQKLEKGLHNDMVNMYLVDKVQPQHLRYHKDWNWLVAVIKKLLPELRSIFGTGACSAEVERDVLFLIQNIEHQSYNIEVLWENVVKAIEKVNEIRKS